TCRSPHGGKARGSQELPGRAARESIFPGELIEDFQVARAGQFETKARLPGTFLDDKEPAGIVIGILTRLALGLFDGEIETEEVDVGVGLRFVERTANLAARRV